MLEAETISVDLTHCPRCGELAQGEISGKGSTTRQLPYFERITLELDFTRKTKRRMVLKW